MFTSLESRLVPIFVLLMLLVPGLGTQTVSADTVVNGYADLQPPRDPITGEPVNRSVGMLVAKRLLSQKAELTISISGLAKGSKHYWRVIAAGGRVASSRPVGKCSALIG